MIIVDPFQRWSRELSEKPITYHRINQILQRIQESGLHDKPIQSLSNWLKKIQTVAVASNFRFDYMPWDELRWQMLKSHLVGSHIILESVLFKSDNFLITQVRLAKEKFICKKILNPRKLAITVSEGFEVAPDLFFQSWLDHPNILPCYPSLDFKTSVLPITEEESLLKYAFNVAAIKIIARDIFSALKYLNDKSIIHGNISIQSIGFYKGRFVLKNFERSGYFGSFPLLDASGVRKLQRKR